MVLTEACLTSPSQLKPHFQTPCPPHYKQGAICSQIESLPPKWWCSCFHPWQVYESMAVQYGEAPVNAMCFQIPDTKALHRISVLSSSFLVSYLCTPKCLETYLHSWSSCPYLMLTLLSIAMWSQP